MEAPVPPVLFISYSWTTPAHEDRVRDLATELRNAWSLDVRLDKWHLRTGEDALHFMERGISEADRVLIVSDCEYARKANAREGGAGVEAQILTPELYEQAGGDGAGGELPKFAVAVTEHGANGRACTPRFYGGRIFIDLTDPTRHAEKVREIAMWAHGRQPFEPPPIGGRPDFLNTGPTTGTYGARTRAITALAASRPDAARAAEDYIDQFVGGLDAYVPLGDTGGLPSTQDVLDSARALAEPYREAETVLIELARARLGSRGHEAFRRLFTRLFSFVLLRLDGGPPTLTSEAHTEPFDYFVPDLFRAAAAALVQARDFEGVRMLSIVPYVCSEQGGRKSSVLPFVELSQGILTDLERSLRDLRNRRVSAFSEVELKQADVLLCLIAHFSLPKSARYGWFPSLVMDSWPRERGGVLPLFGQAQSRSYLARLAQAFGTTGSELKAHFVAAAAIEGREAEKFGLSVVDIKSVVRPELLGTRP